MNNRGINKSDADEAPHAKTTSSSHQGVTQTGLMTNYWKSEARRPNFWSTHPFHGKATREKPLFKDDYMPLFINDEATAEAKRLLDPKLALAIAVRHKYLNNTLSQGIKSSSYPTQQVVLLGSGYDTRPVRKRKYKVTFFEIDKNPVLNNKRNIYIQNNIDPNAVYLEINYLEEDFIDRLIQSGLDLSLSTHFIWEGNTLYLEQADIYSILKKLSQAFSGKLSISFDYRAPSFKTEPPVPEINKMEVNLKSVKAPMSESYPVITPEKAEELGYTIINNIACAELTKKYGVGNEPYASQKNYFLCTLDKNQLSKENSPNSRSISNHADTAMGQKKR